MMVARACIQRVGSGLLGSPRRFTAIRHKLLSAGARLSTSVDRAKLPLRESRQIGADYFRRLRFGGFRSLQGVALRETLGMAIFGRPCDLAKWMRQGLQSRLVGTAFLRP